MTQATLHAEPQAGDPVDSTSVVAIATPTDVAMGELFDPNLYLFFELGFDEGHEPSEVGDDWPFALVPVGTLRGVAVYEIQLDGERHFVTANPANVFPAAGMEAADLEVAWAGQAWIGERDPIDLGTSAIGHEAVPPGPERRRACEALAAGAPLLEGLYLRATGEYLVLTDTAAAGTSLARSRLRSLVPQSRGDWAMRWAGRCANRRRRSYSSPIVGRHHPTSMVDTTDAVVDAASVVEGLDPVAIDPDQRAQIPAVVDDWLFARNGRGQRSGLPR